jgi:hypothetical protein
MCGLTLLELALKQHVTKVTNASFHHLLGVCQIWHRVGQYVIVSCLVIASVIPLLDFCPSQCVYAGLPSSTIAAIQLLQPDQSPSSDLETTLHWLLVSQHQITLKLCARMCSIQTGRCPVDLPNIVDHGSIRLSRCSLRPADGYMSKMSRLYARNVVNELVRRRPRPPNTGNSITADIRATSRQLVRTCVVLVPNVPALTVSRSLNIEHCNNYHYI